MSEYEWKRIGDMDNPAYQLDFDDNYIQIFSSTDPRDGKFLWSTKVKNVDGISDKVYTEFCKMFKWCMANHQAGYGLVKLCRLHGTDKVTVIYDDPEYGIIHTMDVTSTIEDMITTGNVHLSIRPSGKSQTYLLSMIDHSGQFRVTIDVG